MLLVQLDKKHIGDDSSSSQDLHRPKLQRFDVELSDLDLEVTKKDFGEVLGNQLKPRSSKRKTSPMNTLSYARFVCCTVARWYSTHIYLLLASGIVLLTFALLLSAIVEGEYTAPIVSVGAIILLAYAVSVRIPTISI